jgi:hypothetical protein
MNLCRNEIASFILQPRQNGLSECYIVLSTISQSSLRRFNVSYTVVERTETRVNFTEVSNEQGEIIVVQYGNYTIVVEDLIPNLRQYAAPSEVRHLRSMIEFYDLALTDVGFRLQIYL